MTLRQSLVVLATAASMLFLTCSFTATAAGAKAKGAYVEAEVGEPAVIQEARRPEGGSGENSPLAFPQRFEISVGGGGWTYARNTVAGYVLGGAHSEWTFDAVGSESANDWFVGYLYGSTYQGCGWILAQDLKSKSGTPKVYCSSGWQLSESGFSNGQFNCSNGCGAGLKVDTTAAAQAYANVRPWEVPNEPTGATWSVEKGACVEWRYVTKAGSYVMVKNPAKADSEDSWAFIPRSSLPSSLPTGGAGQC